MTMPASIPAGLTVTTVAHRTFGAGPTRFDPSIDRVFFSDQTRSGGIALRHDVLDTARGNRFEDMGAELLAELGELPEIDLLLLAYSTPDLLGMTAAGPMLGARLSGHTRILAVTDQGRSAPFSVLALAQSYQRRHGFRHVLVMAFDQSVLPYESPRSGSWSAAGDAATALLLEQDSSGDGYRVRQRCGLEPGEVADRLAELIAELDPAGTALLAIGSEVDPAWVPAASRRAPAGYPCTALLGCLAEGTPMRDRPVLLVEYEPAQGDVSACRIEPVAA
ncbi:hypothetical protein [Nocardia sp. NPDC051570]|uniref:hypothetical protein n=1 Tax=Nocardia sp. NPDC051570 TaxID=3364324 RepID=UPI0037B2C2D5